MSSRDDIIDGTWSYGRKYGLIYTRKCGWVDLGHANPEGPRELWLKIRNEESEVETEDGFFRISYSLEMSKSRFNVTVKASSKKRYDIKKGLSMSEKQSVALAILIDVSHSFEYMQTKWPFRLATDSGYSAEDLVSNIISFYRALNPNIDYLRVCQPVSLSTALEIWDRHGAVGENKNRTHVPYLYPVLNSGSGVPMCAELPLELNIIKPAIHGQLFKEVR